MMDNRIRLALAVLVAWALVTFSYNQVAQARAARYKVLNPSQVIDTWSGQVCGASGCRPLPMDSQRPDSAIH